MAGTRSKIFAVNGNNDKGLVLSVIGTCIDPPFTSFLTREADFDRYRLAKSRDKQANRLRCLGLCQRTKVHLLFVDIKCGFAGLFMGRAGIEPATLGLKVRNRELRRTAGNGNVLQLVRIGAATNCSEMQDLETNLYAHSYARILPLAATGIL
jgi:hypothetical protein